MSGAKVGRFQGLRRRLFSESSVDKEYFKKNIEQQPVEDITLNIFYQSRSITILVLIVAALTWVAFTRSTDHPLEDDLFHGALCVIAVFLIISVMIMPNGPFTRPHPLVWRVVFGASLLYFLSIVFVLFLRLEDARKILFYLDPALRKMRHSDILDKEYAVNCSQVDLARVWSHMDVFAFGHFFGWLIKAILLRHYFILWTLSINWEITEIAFSHILPNFQECWWDSILLDILLCNGLGIWVGMLFCKWFDARSYEWESIRDIRSTRGKLKRLVLQFTPASWTPTHWLDRSSTIKRALQLSILIVFWQLAELNVFFLKHIFIVKPGHWLTQLRIGIITLSSAPAIRQFYHYVTDDRVTRVGSQMWIFTSTLLVEALVCFKLGREVFEHTILWNVVYWLIWLVISSFLTVFASLWFAQRFGKPQHAEEETASSKIPLSTIYQRDTESDDEVAVRRRGDTSLNVNSVDLPAPPVVNKERRKDQ
nr:unnamed protein product [Spirometra erinaceieuropaei]